MSRTYDDGAGYNTARLSLNTPLSHQQRFNLMHSFHRSPLVAPQHPFNGGYYTNSNSYFASPPTIPPGLGTWQSRPSSVVEEDWIDDEGNESARSLGLVVARGTLLVVITPVDGSEEIANPFAAPEE